MVSLDVAFRTYIHTLEFVAKVVIKGVGMGVRTLFCTGAPEKPLDEYIQTGFRQHVVQPLQQKREITSTPKQAVVSGGSIGGMMAAMLLAKEGYDVHVYEKREAYTRNIQWLARQALADELASIDQDLYRRFYQEVARPLEKGSIHIEKGVSRTKSHMELRDTDPWELPKSAAELMASPSIFSIEARVFETFLKTQAALRNVHFHTGSIHLEQCGDSYAVEGQEQVPDLIVIAEGANSETRKKLGIRQQRMIGRILLGADETPSIARSLRGQRLQIAGAIGINSGGVMIKHVRTENDLRLLTGVVGHADSDKTWIVADIDPSFDGADQETIDNEFRRLASLALELPLERIKDLVLVGPRDGEPIRPFILEQKVSDKAAIGDNVILTGDAVGNCHWSVGGGMQLAAVSHIERLKALISDLAQGILKGEALKKYSEGILSDSSYWCKTGDRDFCRFTKDYWQEKIKDMVLC